MLRRVFLVMLVAFECSAGEMTSGEMFSAPFGALEISPIEDLVLAPPGLPVYWYEPGRHATQYVDGTAVDDGLRSYGTEDKEAVQTVASRQPTFRNPCEASGTGAAALPCIDFDGGDWLTVTHTAFLSTIPQPITVAAVVQPDLNNYDLAIDASAQDEDLRLGFKSSGKVTLNAGLGYIDNSTATTANSYNFICSETNGATSTLYLNGTGELVSSSPGLEGLKDGIFIGNSSPTGLSFHGSESLVLIYDDGTGCDDIYNDYVVGKWGAMPQAAGGGTAGDGEGNMVDCYRPGSSLCPETGVCRFLSIGDSLVSGSTNGDGRQGVGSSLFDLHAKPACVEHVKMGASGQQSTVFEAGQYDVRPTNIDFDGLLIHGPSNDITSIPGATSWANVKSIVDEALDNGGFEFVIVSGIHPQAARTGFVAAYETRRDAFNAAAAAYVKTGYTYVSTESLGDGADPPNMTATLDDGVQPADDGLHFSRSGETAGYAPLLLPYLEGE